MRTKYLILLLLLSCNDELKINDTPIVIQPIEQAPVAYPDSAFHVKAYNVTSNIYVIEYSRNNWIDRNDLSLYGDPLYIDDKKLANKLVKRIKNINDIYRIQDSLNIISNHCRRCGNKIYQPTFAGESLCGWEDYGCSNLYYEDNYEKLNNMEWYVTKMLNQILNAH